MILCFSGTGNSRYIAKKIAAELEDEIVDVNAKIKAADYSPVKTGENVIVVTPTYAWRIPRIVSDWLSKMKLLSAKRIWFVMNCGSEIGNASKYNSSLAERKHLCYMGTSQILMPENYIAMFDAPEAEEETEEAEKYETVEIEYSEDDIEAYIVDEDDNEIGFILLDEDGNEIEYYYDDDEEAAKGESDEDNPYDLGITREGVAEATSDMNDIYRDGVAIAVDLKDALSEIKEALDFSDILPTKKK